MIEAKSAPSPQLREPGTSLGHCSCAGLIPSKYCASSIAQHEVCVRLCSIGEGLLERRGCQKEMPGRMFKTAPASVSGVYLG